MIRLALLALSIAAAFLWLPELWRVDAPKPAPGRRPGTSVYAADGTFVAGNPPTVRPKNLILILLDTVRRDCMSVGDEPSAQMPELSRLGRRGIAFEHASSPSSWTLPVIASVFTGLLPHEHGVMSETPTPEIRPEITTYAEVLARNFGFQTAAFSDIPFQRRRRTSVLQGFQAGSAGQGHLLRRTRPLDSGFWLHGGERIVERWISKRDPARPFFLFLHTYDAHDAYGPENHPPAALKAHESQQARQATVLADGPLEDRSAAELTEIFLTNGAARSMIGGRRSALLSRRVNEYMLRGWNDAPDLALADRLRRAYLRGVRWTDEGLGKFVRHLETEGLLEDTLLVIFSDHGEAFGEHGILGHGRQLDCELTRVPMVMLGPGPFATPRVIDASAGVIDILPTFLDWIGAPDITESVGRSLLPLIGEQAPGHPVLAQVQMLPGVLGWERHVIRNGVRSEAWSYLLEVEVGAGKIRERLYDLANDPEELHDLASNSRIGTSHALPRSFAVQVELVRDWVWGSEATAGRISAGAPPPRQAYDWGEAIYQVARPASVLPEKDR